MKVSELLNTPEKWTQQAMARNEDKYSVGLDSSKAVAWCLYGALLKCYPETDDDFFAAKSRLNYILDISKILDWNDRSDTTYADVMQVVELADV